MKALILILFFMTINGICTAETITYSIIHADKMPRLSKEAMAASEKDDKVRPDKRKYLLENKNTDYYLVNFDDTDLPSDLKPYLAEAEIYQIYERTEDRGMIKVNLTVDNSNKFDLNKQWKVYVSSK